MKSFLSKLLIVIMFAASCVSAYAADAPVPNTKAQSVSRPTRVGNQSHRTAAQATKIKNHLAATGHHH